MKDTEDFGIFTCQLVGFCISTLELFEKDRERPRKTCTSTGVKGTYTLFSHPFASPRIGDALSRLDSLRSGIVITGGGRMESELSDVQESEVSEVSEEPAEKLFAEGL